MELTLANPLGLWALLAIPVIVAIHFLQRKKRRYVVSTLFLVPDNKMQARRGSRFQFWRNSASFWMQIVSALLIAWMLAQPRWIAADFRQQVVVIYDASVSMQAFEAEREAALEELVASLSRVTKRTEWLLLPSDSREGVRYRGLDANAFLDSARSYQPSAGTHSFEAAYRLAESLDSEARNRILLFSDHIPEALPERVELYAIGHALPNVGFSGLTVAPRDGVLYWRASVRNYGDQSVDLRWQLQAGDAAAIESGLNLSARSTKILTGPFPDDRMQAVELTLPEDALSADNRITILPPQRKAMQHVLSGSEGFTAGLSPVVESVTSLPLSQNMDDAHMVWLTVGDGADWPQVTTPAAVCFREQPSGEARTQGFYTSERDPLMDGLSWNALIYTPLSQSPELLATDRVLLWHDRVPLIYLRESMDQRMLCFAFDPMQSNALRLPAFVILLNRYVVECEAVLPLYQAVNFEGNQSLGLELLEVAGTDRIELFEDGATEEAGRVVPVGSIVRAPVLATTLHATLNGAPLLDASVYFAETMEADLLQARSHNMLEQQSRELIENNSEEDFLMPVWLILLSAALLLNWYFCGKGR